MCFFILSNQFAILKFKILVIFHLIIYHWRNSTIIINKNIYYFFYLTLFSYITISLLLVIYFEFYYLQSN